VLHRQQSMTVSAAAGLSTVHPTLTWPRPDTCAVLIARARRACRPPDGVLLGAIEEPAFGIAG